MSLETLFPSPTERERAEELLFSLHHRKSANVFWLSTNSTARQQELISWLTSELPEYKHVTLHVTGQVETLFGYLRKNIPQEIWNQREVQTVVHLTGLEHHHLRYAEGKMDTLGLAAQLNFERENLFAGPFLLLIWGSPVFFHLLARDAQDLSSWVSERYHFSNHPDMWMERISSEILLSGSITTPDPQTDLIADWNQQLSMYPINEQSNDKEVTQRLALLETFGEKAKDKEWLEVSLNYWEQALQLRLRQKHGDEPLASAIFSISDVLVRLGRPAEALSFLKFRENELKLALKSQSISHSLLMNIKGEAYRQIGDYHTAKAVLEENLESLLKKESNDHQQIADTQSNLGNVFRNLGDYYRARDLLEVALASKIKRYGPFSSELTTTQVNLGNTYIDLGDFQRAKDLLEAALDSNMKVYGMDHQRTILSMS
ncbi:MAG: tetratricopeptide repeat protein, partial [Bacteroidota bacterium]